MKMKILAFAVALTLATNLSAQTFTTLHSFWTSFDLSGVNSDGAYPIADLILSGDTLYGTTGQGGSSNNGVIFGVNTDGSGFRILHDCSTQDGGGPDGLILSGSTLYGTSGTLNKVNTDGTGFTVLYNFSDFPQLNSVLSGNTLYGTTSDGGENGYYGTVFAVNTDGSNSLLTHRVEG